MAEKSYRLQTDSGLSEAYTLEQLREVASDGSVETSVQCTADGGKTWVTVGSIVDSAPSNVAVETKASTPVESAPQNNEADTSPDSTSTGEPSRATRKLRRISKGDGESKFAKRRADREQRKASEKAIKLKDLIGVELAGGRYTVKSMLGKGSMAYVFLVSDSRLETDAVVKVPKPEKFTTADFRERFKRESQLLVRFSHPHVVKVLDVGEHETLPYVVMQLLSGGSLSDRLEKESDDQGRMSPESLKSWVREVGRALDFCFRKGMVHRDVKPANILFDEDNNPYVADFGLSKIMYGEHEDLNSSETAAGIVLGTPNYISPEIVLGQPYDGRADQYSMGITIYHALTGKAPMQGNSATATMVNQTQMTLDMLCDVRPDAVSRPLANAIRKSIEKDPKKRFASCEEFAEAVLEGLRVPVAKSAKSGSSSASAVRPSAAKSANSGTASAKVPAKKRGGKSTESAASSASKQSSGSSQSLDPDLDWFGASDESAATKPKRKRPAAGVARAASSSSMAALPPRKGGNKRKSSKSKKSGKPDVLSLFGANVHPAIAIGIGVFLGIILLVVVIMRFTGGEEEPAVVTDVSSPDGNAVAVDVPGGDDNSGKSSNGQGGNEGRAGQPARSGPAEPPENPANSPKIAALTPAEAATSSNSTAPATSSSAKAPPAAVPPAAAQSKLPPKLAVKQRFDSIPFEPSEGFTVGAAACPILMSGNRVWDKDSKSVRHRLDGTFDGRAQTTMSPDGRLFAAASKPPDQQNTSVTVWDTQTGKQLFTAAGDSKRFADVILLSSTRLYIGDRWSPELFVWNCETGEKEKKPIKLNDAKFKRGNAAISHDGSYIAAMAQGRLIILNTADGNIGGLMQNPSKSVRMKRVSLKKGSGRSNKRKSDLGKEAEPIFAATQSLAFSADNKELAGFSTFPRSRIMAWNSQGELTVDQAASSPGPAAQNGAFQWFADRNAWLVSGSILDRDTGRVVLTTLSDNAKRTSVSVYDDDNLVSVLRNSPTKLSIVPIPWDIIESTLSQIKNSDSAVVADGTSVSLQIQMEAIFDKGSQELNDVRKALRETLVREGLKVDQGYRTVFRLKIAKTSEAKVSILDRLTLPDQRQTPPAAAVQPDGDCLVVELLTAPDAETPIWRINLGALADLGLVDTPKRVTADRMMALLDEMSVPYYIPRDEQAVGLPIVVD